MMRKKTKMAWSVALSAAMAAGLLAGCGSNGGAESTSGSTAASSAKTESSASDTTDTSDRPTYKIATVRWTDTWPTDFLHEGVMKEIEDKMNINIDWQVYYNSDWSEQKSLLLASGDLPDAFLGSLCLTQADGGSQVGLVFGWTADAEGGPNVNQFKTLEAVEGYDGNHYVEAATNYLDISDRELMISKDCKDPDTLLKWADEFYTDLVSLQTFYGTIGSQITDNGDGTYSVDVPSDGSSLDTSAWSNSLRDFGPKYMNGDFYDKVSLPEDQGDGIKLADDAINEKYVDTEKNCGFPMVQYTDEDLSRITAIGTDIYKYVEAQYAHWVVDGGIDDEWDSYIDQLKAMGIDEFLQIQTDAYNAYKENLAK